MNLLKQNYDVIVFGCGPAGCAATISLLENGLNVCMVSNESKSFTHVGENLDASARYLFPSLHIDLDYMNQVHLPAYEKVSLWGSDDPLWQDSIFEASANGWHLDRKKFDVMLVENCLQRGVKRHSCSSASINHSGAFWQVELKTNDGYKTLKGKFIVDASGRSRILNKHISNRVLKYDTLMAINTIYRIPNEDCEPYTTVVEAVEHGWWYSARLPDNDRIISFFTNAKSPHFKRMTCVEELIHAVSATKLLSKIIGKVSLSRISKPFYRYANSEKATCTISDSYLITGDAAATFDPLSSQGITTALKMGSLAGHSLSAHFNHDKFALIDYALSYEKLFADYLHYRKKYYAMNRKYLKTEFWYSNS